MSEQNARKPPRQDSHRMNQYGPIWNGCEWIEVFRSVFMTFYDHIYHSYTIFPYYEDTLLWQVLQWIHTFIELMFGRCLSCGSCSPPGWFAHSKPGALVVASTCGFLMFLGWFTVQIHTQSSEAYCIYDIVYKCYIIYKIWWYTHKRAIRCMVKSLSCYSCKIYTVSICFIKKRQPPTWTDVGYLRPPLPAFATSAGRRLRRARHGSGQVGTTTTVCASHETNARFRPASKHGWKQQSPRCRILIS